MNNIELLEWYYDIHSICIPCSFTYSPVLLHSVEYHCNVLCWWPNIHVSHILLKSWRLALLSFSIEC